MYNKIVIGVDQSYKNTGISVVADGKVKMSSSLRLELADNNTERRQMLYDRVLEVIDKVQDRAKEVIVIIERIRLKSQGFISMPYIKSIGSLNATIVDAARRRGKKVYSVDTRAWKSAVVGSCKPKENKYGIDKKKWLTILFVKSLIGYKKIVVKAGDREKKGVIEIDGNRYKINDDLCDSVCIGLYGFKPNQKLEEEH